LAFLLNSDQNQNQGNSGGQQDQLLNNGVPLQNNTNNNNQQQNNQGSNAGAGSGGSGLQNQSAGDGSKQGSGRFTNLQQYIGANQGAGNNISSNVQSNIGNAVKSNQQAAQSADTTGQSNVTAGNALIAQGQGFQNQMSDKSFTPDQAVAFAQNNGNVQAVNNLETGKAIDVNALNAQNQTANSAAANYQQQAGQYQGQVGNDLGQQQLLKNVYGNQNHPGYTQGDNLLDMLMLQQTPGSLSNLQNAVQGINTNANQVVGDVANQAAGIQNLGTQQSALGAQLQNTTNANVQGLQTNLQNQLPGFNKNITDQVTQANQFLDFNNQAITDDAFKAKYGVDKATYGGNSDLFNKFGLQNNQQTFNVFNNPNLSLSNVASNIGQQAQNWQQVANQQNVNQYAALAQLANIQKPNYALMKATDITGPYTLNTGDTSLEGMINKAQQDFMKQAQGETVTGYNNYINGVRGSSTANLGNVLNTGGNIWGTPDIGTQYTQNGSDYWGTTAAGYDPTLAPGYVGAANPTTGNPAYNGGINANPASNPTFFGGSASAAARDNAAPQGPIPVQATGHGIATAVGSFYGGPVGGMAAGAAYNNMPHNPLQGALEGINNISNQLTGNSGDDVGAGEWWARHQTEGNSQKDFAGSALGKQIEMQLNKEGFNNYITQNGVKSYDFSDLGNIGKFGYGPQVPSGNNVSIGATTVGANAPKPGFYNPDQQAALQQLAGAHGGQVLNTSQIG
jgi:hypothetical protein